LEQLKSNNDASLRAHRAQAQTRPAYAVNKTYQEKANAKQKRNRLRGGRQG
jgi:hypothetical protein